MGAKLQFEPPVAFERPALCVTSHAGKSVQVPDRPRSADPHLIEPILGKTGRRIQSVRFQATASLNLSRRYQSPGHQNSACGLPSFSQTPTTSATRRSSQSGWRVIAGSFFSLFKIAKRVHARATLYAGDACSLHEPNVKFVAESKYGGKCRFGIKQIIAVTSKRRRIVGAMSLPGKP